MRRQQKKENKTKKRSVRTKKKETRVFTVAPKKKKVRKQTGIRRGAALLRVSTVRGVQKASGLSFFLLV